MVAPELGNVFRNLKDTAAQTAADRFLLLKEQLARAYSQQNFEEITRLGSELGKLEGLSEELTAIDDPFSAILHRRGVSTFEIPETVIYKFQPPEVAVPTEKKPPEHHWRNAEKYVDHARPTLLSRIMDRDGRGRFRYKTIRDVASGIVKTPEVLEDAANYIYAEKAMFIDGLQTLAKKYQVQTMRAILEAHLGADFSKKVKNTHWLKLYEDIYRNYGSLTIDDFAQKVINRFHVQAPAKPSHPERLEITPKILAAHPEAELVLVSLLLREGTVARIQSVFVTGDERAKEKDFAKKLKELGWSIGNKSLNEVFSESQQAVCQVRQNKPITKEESLFAHRAIEDVLSKLYKSRAGWHQIPRSYTGFQFLYRIIGMIGEDSSKMTQLRKILFDPKTITVDGISGFIQSVQPT